MTLRIGSLCTGYGGLDMGVQSVVGGSLAWVSDVCGDLSKGQEHRTPHGGPCAILAHHHPDVPNLGDLTRVDWPTVEPVDVLTAGFPCQPVSLAGKRLGSDDERWLWDDVARAVRDLRPGLVVLENVRGLVTARGGRLFGRVVGSLAGLGYDVQWCGVRASDVGAPHERWRIFLVATDTRGVQRDSRRVLDQGRETALPGEAGGHPRDGGYARLLPTPRTSDTNGPGRHGHGGLDLRTAVTLLPTVLTDPNAGNGHARDLGSEVRLLPTPLARDSKTGYAQGGPPGRTGQASPEQWAQYGPAVTRWESLTRPAPPPTSLNSKGNYRLSPAFEEWMMGLPAGYVTQMHALGNGVVPQQAALAVRHLLTRDTRDR